MCILYLHSTLSLSHVLTVLHVTLHLWTSTICPSLILASLLSLFFPFSFLLISPLLPFLLLFCFNICILPLSLLSWSELSKVLWLMSSILELYANKEFYFRHFFPSFFPTLRSSEFFPSLNISVTHSAPKAATVTNISCAAAGFCWDLLQRLRIRKQHPKIHVSACCVKLRLMQAEIDT